jgi:hypothetical protein
MSVKIYLYAQILSDKFLLFFKNLSAITKREIIFIRFDPHVSFLK